MRKKLDMDFHPFGHRLVDVALYSLDRFVLACSWATVNMELHGTMSIW